MSKILVTGASGFIGKNLCQKLKERGHEINALFSLHGDISESHTLDKYHGKVDKVIHLAASTFVPNSWEKPDEFFKVNALGTMRVLEFCRNNNSALIFISAYLYGIPDKVPTSETELPKPNNPYAFSKYIAEQACLFYSGYLNIPSLIIRPFNVYGPGQPDHFLIPTIINQVIENKQITVLDLHPKRDYVYIDDLIEFIIMALDFELKNAEIVNIGSGVSYSVNDLIQVIQRISGTNLPVFSKNEVRFQEISDVIADVNKAATLFCWKPKTTLEVGLKHCVSYSKLKLSDGN
jgi:nucleoside-diphosphate-sugar epimerase